jgi:hypothetical protein
MMVMEVYLLSRSMIIYGGQLIYKYGQINFYTGQLTGQIGQYYGQSYINTKEKRVYIEKLILCLNAILLSINNN